MGIATLSGPQVQPVAARRPCPVLGPALLVGAGGAPAFGPFGLFRRTGSESLGWLVAPRQHQGKLPFCAGAGSTAHTRLFPHGLVWGRLLLRGCCQEGPGEWGQGTGAPKGGCQLPHLTCLPSPVTGQEPPWPCDAFPPPHPSPTSLPCWEGPLLECLPPLRSPPEAGRVHLFQLPGFL